MLRTTVPNHMFVGYPVEMADESRFLFDICKSYKLQTKLSSSISFNVYRQSLTPTSPLSHAIPKRCLR